MPVDTPVVTWSARRGERAHAFAATSSGWMRSKCGVRWTAAFYDHNAPRCAMCAAVVRSEERDRAREGSR